MVRFLMRTRYCTVLLSLYHIAHIKIGTLDIIIIIIQVRQGNKGGEGEGEGVIRVAQDPPVAALRARLKHRETPPSAPTSSSSTANTTTAYDKVLDTARRLAELETQRAQDQIYIRTLEQTRATLMRDAQSAARARAEAERAVAGERDARRARDEAVLERDEAVRVAGLERERAERAEGRERAIGNALRGEEERAHALECALEEERKRREEWESGLDEALAIAC